MSVEYAVNRTPSTPALKAELKEAGLAELDIKPDILASAIEAAPLIEEALESPAIQEAIAEQGLEVDQDILTKFRTLVGSEDHKVFRGQVIRAFKHLGLDTRQFFGE